MKVGARWSSAEILLSVPIRLGTLAILARMLTPTEFGIFAAGVTVIEFARPLSTLSMDHALVQSKKLTAESIAFASVFALGLSLAVAVMMALNANLVLLLYDDPEVPGLLVALAWSVPIAAASSLLLAILRRELAFRALSVIAFISSTVASLTAVALAVAGWGIWALVAGYYADLALKLVFAGLVVRPDFVRLRIGQETRKLLRFGAGSTLSSMLNFWALHGDYVIIGSVLGPKPLGYYSRSYQLISTVPGMLGRLQNMVLFPAFSRAQSDRSYLAKALRVGTEATAALTLPFCAWGLVLGPETIFVLLGPGWEEAVVPFQILALGLYFRSTQSFAASIILATGHVFSFSACQGIYAVLIVVGGLFGAQWGIAGVAMATLLALFVFYLLLYALAARVSGASLWSLPRVHAGPVLVFAIVVVTAALGRTSLRGLDWPPIAVLVGSVSLGIVALIGLTRLLKNRLWGDFLYQQGQSTLGLNAPATEAKNQEHDDIKT